MKEEKNQQATQEKIVSTRTEPHDFTQNMSLINITALLHESLYYFYMQNGTCLNFRNWWPSKASKQSIRQFTE